MKPLLETILSRKLHDPKVAIYKWLDQYGITNYTLNDKGEIDVDGSVDLSYKDIEEFPYFIQFGVVRGYFNCDNNKLISLRGCPRVIKKGFNCSFNNLTSLRGCPRVVKKSFYCHDNKLVSLEGSPETVSGSFYCSFNNLTSLEGAPKIVKEVFNCRKNTTQFTEDDVRKVCNVKSIYV